MSENNGKIIIIRCYQVHIFASFYWPINLQKNSLKVNSTYLIFITEINAKSTLDFVCDLAKYAVSSI